MADPTHSTFQFVAGMAAGLSGGALSGLFGVGGGVVWDSDPLEEYEETLHKGRSLVQCLS